MAKQHCLVMISLLGGEGGFLALAKKTSHWLLELAEGGSNWQGTPWQTPTDRLTQPNPPLWEVGAHPPRRTYHHPRLLAF